ncbi:DUF3034 family protein [Paraperlucidibaca baekdonensis]|nr:DUF3034 family protein [Paraperlucidibaca baekdonensis]
MKNVLRLHAFALLSLSAAYAPIAQASMGKLVLTGGISSAEGTAGGGITPWAMIGTQATEKELGFAANLSYGHTDDYRIETASVMAGWHERVEFSLAHQTLDTGITGRTLVGPQGLDLKQTIVGAKVRLFGDAILDADSLMPAVSVGVQHKRLDAGELSPTLRSLDASNTGTDVYVSATKLFLKPGLLVNATLRATKANQNGFLGFGGNANDDYELMSEFSVAKLIRSDLAVGMEYRFMPNNLRLDTPNGNGLAADSWKDLFIAWAPSKNLSLTAAYVDFGRIVPATTQGRDQTGFYVSAQLTF